MPAFNAEAFIQQAIDSVLAQTFAAWELIIINDGSTDCTPEIIRRNTESDPRIVQLEQQNKKQAAARNLGFLHCAGQWIAFLDADDLWMPEKLQVQFDYIQRRPEDFFFSGGLMVDITASTVKGYRTIYGHYSSLEMYKSLMLDHNLIPILSVVFKRDLIARVGWQDERPAITGCEDWDYWLRLTQTGIHFFGIKENLFKYRITPGSTSKNILQMHIAESETLLKNNNPQLLTIAENKSLYLRLNDLAKSIVAQLDQSNGEKILGYLYFRRESGHQFKFSVAILFYKIFKSYSRKLILFLLYHL